MKYFKILLLIMTFSSIAYADIERNMIMRETVNRCIYNDYYYEYDDDAGKYKIYYRYAGNSYFNSTGTTKQDRWLHVGYQYDTETEICKPDEWLFLGMDVKDFNFLLGLMGVLIGFTFMWFSIEAFTRVGGKR